MTSSLAAALQSVSSRKVAADGKPVEGPKDALFGDSDSSSDDEDEDDGMPSALTLKPEPEGPQDSNEISSIKKALASTITTDPAAAKRGDFADKKPIVPKVVKK